MKKYLEQRVEQLELEINLLKAKFKLEETKYCLLYTSDAADE